MAEGRQRKHKRYSEPRVGGAGVVFRRFLVAARKRARVNQTLFGKRMGMSHVLISRIENGNRKIDVLELRLICRALKIDFVEFVRELDAQLSDHERNPETPVQPDPEPVRRKR